MYTNIPNDRDNSGYNIKPRENGYRSPYDPEREWNGFSRDKDRERDREYGSNSFYQRTKREWPDREHRNAPERSPSPKRRRLRDDAESPPPYKEYKRNYDSPRYNNYRSGSRSPSPTSGHTHHEAQFPHTSTEKERYNSRDYYRNDRDFKYNRDNDYSRNNSNNNYYSDYNQRRRPWDRDNARNKYDYRGQYSSYRRDTYDEFRDSRRTDYDREYDRYDRDRYDKYNRDHEFDRDRYRDKEHEYDNERGRNASRDREDNDRDSRSRSRDRSGSDSEKGKSANNSSMRDDYYSPSREVEAYDQLDRKDDGDKDGNGLGSGDTPTTPTPKKRLGWGQGLVAFEKGKDPEKIDNAHASPATPTMTQVQVQRTEKVELEVMAISPPPLVKSEPVVVEPIPVQTPQIQPPSQPQPQPQLQQPQPSQPQQSQPSKMQIDGNLGSPSYSPEIQEVKVEKKPEPEPPKEPLPSKEEVLLAIEKLDAEISKTEAQISLLKKPKKEHKHRHLHQNLIQDVIDENKERLAQTTEDHERLLPPNMKSLTQPLYTNPKQLPSYRENIATHAKLKGKIGAIIAKRAVEYEAKQVQIKERYQKIYESWKKKVEKLEERRQRRDSKQKQGKSETDMVLDDQGHRRPMLRSVRSPITPRGRFLGDSARSEAEFEQILFHLREQDNLDPNSKYLQTLAKIPPMILKTKAPVFIDKIGLIPDPMAVERERKLLNAWSEEEKQTFMRKFLTYGKIFSKIATFIEHKSTADVINYYYTNKKTLDLKKLLAQQQAKRRSWGRTKPVTPSTPPTPTPIPGLPRELANLGVTSSSPYWSYAENVRSTRVKASLSSERADQNRPSLLGGDQPEETVEVSTTWTEMEKELFLEGYAKFQTDFKAISNFIGTKNQFQCKNYYHNNKKRFAESLDESGRPRPPKVAKKESSLNAIKEFRENLEKQENKILEQEIRIRKERLDKLEKEKQESSSPPVPTKQPQQQQAQQSNSSEDEDSSDDGPEEEITSRKGARIANTWKSEEKENFLKYFKQYGKNWKKLAALIPSKNANQIKYYYQTNCQKLNLDKIEPEIKEEVVHKKRGRKSNAEKQKLAAKKAAELPTPTTPSTPPSQNLAQPIVKIKSTNSSEFVNVDQESPKTPSPSAPPSLSAVKSESSATSDNSTAMETGASERESVSRSGSVSLRAEESISNEDFDVVDEEDISEFMPSPNNETRFYEFKPKKGNELEGAVDGQQTGPTTVELDSAIQTIRDPNENETKVEESLLVTLPSLKEETAAPMDIETSQSAPSPSPMETEMESSATVPEPVQELAPTEPAVPTSTVSDAVPAPADEEMKTEEPERQVQEEAPVIESPSIEHQLEEPVTKQEEPEEPAAPVSEEQVASPVSEQPSEPQPTEPLNEPVQEQPVEAQTSPVAQEEAPVESEPVAQEEPQVVQEAPVEPETVPPVVEEEVVPTEQVAPTTEEVAPQEPQVQEAEMTEESAPPQVPINESSVEVPVHDTRPSEEEVPATETSQPLPEDPAPEPEPTIEPPSEQPMVEKQAQPESSSVTELAVEPSSTEVEAPSLENLESISVPQVELEPQPQPEELEPSVEVPSAMEIEPAAPENLAPIDSVPLTEVEQKLDFPEFVPETVSNQNYKSEPVVEASSTGTIL